MRRFEQFQALRKEAADLKQALEDRKVIEKAKGILMKKAGLDEHDAFRRLQKLASDKNRKLIEIAQMILTAEEALEPPEPVLTTIPLRDRTHPRRPRSHGTPAVDRGPLEAVGLSPGALTRSRCTRRTSRPSSWPGRLAYKLKKPVKLGFVDYSTLERRRHFCEEEVRLNRRLAPDVYLGVVPVTREGDSIRVEGTGEVVEWAVKMRRLPESATLRARIAGGGVDAAAMAELARRLARFHASAESGPEVAASCTFEAIAANARENLDQSAPQVGRDAQPRDLRSVARPDRSRPGAPPGPRSRRAPAAASPATPTATSGSTTSTGSRSGSRPTIGSWSTASSSTRGIAMPTPSPTSPSSPWSWRSRAGRTSPMHSSRTTSTPLATRRDGRLLPFYRAYRAAVRGKVEGMKLAEPEIPEADRAAARVRARALWLSALSELEEPGRRPCLVLLAGLPGSGKSTLARSLAERAGFTVIRSDAVRKELAGRPAEAPAPAAFGEDIYTPEWDDRTYAECLRRAEKVVFQAGRVLVDASFREESRRRLFLDAARRWGIAGRLLLCQADADVVRRRLDHRSDDASDAGWAIYLEAARRWESLGQTTRAHTHEIDAGGSRSQVLEQAFAALRQDGLLE